MKFIKVVILFIVGLSLACAGGGGCREGKPSGGGAKGPDPRAAKANEEPGREGRNPGAANPDRIELSDAVRQNLGITFAKAEMRRVVATLRVAGRFELLPTARREYHADVPGHVQMLVQQFQSVEPGTVLYRVASPEWLKLRQQIQEEQAGIEKARVAVSLAKAALEEARQAVALVQRRIDALAGAEVRRAELETQLAERKNAIPRLDVEVRSKQLELDSAIARFPLTLASAASLINTTPEKLTEMVETPAGAKPRWATIEVIEVKATEAGVVETLALNNGGWVEASKGVLTTVNAKALRFRAVGLQADLGRLRDGLPATIVPPRGGKLETLKPLPGKLTLAIEGNSESRTIELVVTPEQLDGWARAGVGAFLEIVVDGSDDPELAIPVAAVIQDELTHVFFRQDPKDADAVIRTEADLGVSDGKWVVVNSGLKKGDQVVVDGVYELKLAASAKGGGGAPKGHFHADGSYHEGKDGEKK